MNITVINGSPAGSDSITLQTALYIQAYFPDHSWEFINAGAQIKLFEKDFGSCLEKLRKADLIIFCYPVYTFLVPYQLHRFIELIRENGIDLSGKCATQISTSKHFYDITAHQFIEDQCDDLNINYIRGLSADMEDLLSEKGREEALSFFRYVLFCIKEEVFEPRFPYVSEKCTYAFPSDTEDLPLRKPWKIAVVCDLSSDDDGRLQAMIRRFTHRMEAEVKLIRIDEFPFRGGCLGCFRCASDGRCVYSDGFDAFLRESIQTADAAVYAYTVKNHSMGSLFKMFDDRQFCNGHRTVTMSKPVGYLVNGDLREEFNLKNVMEARSQVGGNFLAGIASDVTDIDRDIDTLAKRLTYALDYRYRTPANFWGVGGMKIFRDLIWQMQGLMKEDHRFYKEHGFYDDFPQKHKAKTAAMYLAGAMMNSPKISKKLGSKMTEGMIMPYQAVIRKAQKKKKG